MRQTTTYQLIQVRMGRDLAQWVAAQRADGKSWRAIAQDVSAVTGVAVSHETVRAWFTEAAA